MRENGERMKGLELCRPCAENRKKKGQRLVLAYHGVNEKITCADCRRRRYGAKYIMG